jgi:cellulose synthase/poly-beta-1,6-N-acetylglucosamine synthase-like glycosyltransferase
MLVSVVLNIMNEEKNIADLLDSLVVQEQPLEIVVVDAKSRDKTRDIVQKYVDKYPFVKLYVESGSRGHSTNFGIKKATGELIAFTGGDCKTVTVGADIVAGRCINIGLKSWEELDRVELYYKGADLSFPSANMVFKREVLEKVGGFDTWFITAEDIDLNFRSVAAGYKIMYNPDSIVYHRTKATVYRFYKQAYWNGVGRKQLTLKHGRLWGNYDPMRMFKQKMSFWAFTRLVVAMGGYVAYKIFDAKPPYSKRLMKKSG